METMTKNMSKVCERHRYINTGNQSKNTNQYHPIGIQTELCQQLKMYFSAWEYNLVAIKRKRKK